MKNFDFSGFASIQKKIGELSQQRSQTANDSFQEAIGYLKKFNQGNFDKTLLEKAAEKLISSLETKKSQAEPYAYLAYIYYILDQDRLAVKYLKAAVSINPNLPEVLQLREVINKNIPVSRKRTLSPVSQAGTTEKNENPGITKVNRIQSVKRLK